MKNKFLQEAHDELGNLKSGMENNLDVWKNQEVKPNDLENTMGELIQFDEDIKLAETKLQEVRKAAHNKVLLVQTQINEVTNLALGLHAKTEDKLGGYGIKPTKKPIAKEIPTKANVANIEDDHDGEGFILTASTLQTANYYEWQKMVGPNGEEMLKPPFPFFKTSKKTTFVDDEVPQGKRCFYRVRGVNTAGPGEWSEPVSKVQ